MFLVIVCVPVIGFCEEIQRIAEKRSLYKVYCVGAAFTVRITKIAQQ